MPLNKIRNFQAIPNKQNDKLLLGWSRLTKLGAVCQGRAMYSGQIIDTHMHLWEPANGYAWLPLLANGALNHPFFMKDYLKMAQHQAISQMVHIECGGFPENPVHETKWIQEIADRYGGPQAIIGFVPLHMPEAETMLRQHREYPLFRGIRMPLNKIGTFGADRGDYMQDPHWRKGYALLAKHNLLFEMQIYDVQIPDAVALAKAIPDVPIVLQHLGWPAEVGTPQLFEQWKHRLAMIAACKNVTLKLSCLGWVFQTKDESKILPYLKEALHLFGTDRCVVGSNCPPDTVYLSFDEIFAVLKKALASYPEKEQQKVFYGNAKRLYRL